LFGQRQVEPLGLQVGSGPDVDLTGGPDGRDFGYQGRLLPWPALGS
jgi:hypothetical protein